MSSNELQQTIVAYQLSGRSLPPLPPHSKPLDYKKTASSERRRFWAASLTGVAFFALLLFGVIYLTLSREFYSPIRASGNCPNYAKQYPAGSQANVVGIFKLIAGAPADETHVLRVQNMIAFVGTIYKGEKITLRVKQTDQSDNRLVDFIGAIVNVTGKADGCYVDVEQLADIRIIKPTQMPERPKRAWRTYDGSSQLSRWNIPTEPVAKIKTAVVHLAFPGSTNNESKQRAFGTYLNGANRLLLSESRRQMSFSGSKPDAVFDDLGVFQLNETPRSECRLEDWASEGSRISGVNNTSYDLIVFYFDMSGCGRIYGFADIGGKWVMISTTTPDSQLSGTIFHELGHHFGLLHSNSAIRCTATTCSTSEYGDGFDFMGNGFADPSGNHLNVRSLSLLEWIPTDRLVLPIFGQPMTIESSNATTTVGPIGIMHKLDRPLADDMTGIRAEYLFAELQPVGKSSCAIVLRAGDDPDAWYRYTIYLGQMAAGGTRTDIENKFRINVISLTCEKATLQFDKL